MLSRVSEIEESEVLVRIYIREGAIPLISAFIAGVIFAFLWKVGRSASRRRAFFYGLLVASAAAGISILLQIVVLVLELYLYPNNFPLTQRMFSGSFVLVLLLFPFYGSYSGLSGILLYEIQTRVRKKAT